jgi:hypothetical protein
MALTPDQRLIVDELVLLVPDTELDEDLIYARYVAADNDLNLTASGMWVLLASSYSGLVDIKEGSSSRPIGTLYKNALDMAAFFQGKSDAAKPGGAERRTRTRQIERP